MVFFIIRRYRREFRRAFRLVWEMQRRVAGGQVNVRHANRSRSFPLCMVCPAWNSSGKQGKDLLPSVRGLPGRHEGVGYRMHGVVNFSTFQKCSRTVKVWGKCAAVLFSVLLITPAARDVAFFEAFDRSFRLTDGWLAVYENVLIPDPLVGAAGGTIRQTGRSRQCTFNERDIATSQRLVRRSFARRKVGIR